ncbi:MAG: hypothetical protein ACI83H_002599 [Glaciecola sp.]|jgi:hypothetical protein
MLGQEKLLPPRKEIMTQYLSSLSPILKPPLRIRITNKEVLKV